MSPLASWGVIGLVFIFMAALAYAVESTIGRVLDRAAEELEDL